MCLMVFCRSGISLNCMIFLSFDNIWILIMVWIIELILKYKIMFYKISEMSWEFEI